MARLEFDPPEVAMTEALASADFSPRVERQGRNPGGGEGLVKAQRQHRLKRL